MVQKLTEIDDYYLIENNSIFRKGSQLYNNKEFIGDIGKNSVFKKLNQLYIKQSNVYRSLSFNPFLIGEYEIISNDLTVISEIEFVTLKLEYAKKSSEVSFYKDFQEIWSCFYNDFIRILSLKETLLLSFLNEKSKLLCVNIENGQVRWDFSASELGKFSDHEGIHEGKIDGSILECNGILIMSVTGNKLIGIDNKNGKLLWKNEYPPKGFFYQQYKNEFFTLHENFCQINLHTGEEKSLYPFFKVFEEQNTEAYTKQILTDKYLFTIGQWDLVILQWDKKTGEILWRHELYPKTKTGRNGITLKGDVLEPVQYDNGKLYVLDSTKTLHIFDRQ